MDKLIIKLWSPVNMNLIQFYNPRMLIDGMLTDLMIHFIRSVMMLRIGPVQHFTMHVLIMLINTME